MVKLLKGIMGTNILKWVLEHGSPFYAWQNLLASRGERRNGTVKWGCTISLASSLTNSVRWKSPSSLAPQLLSGDFSGCVGHVGKDVQGGPLQRYLTVAKRSSTTRAGASACAGGAVGAAGGGTGHGKEPRQPDVLLDHRGRVGPPSGKNEYKCRAQMFKNEKGPCLWEVRCSI